MKHILNVRTEYRRSPWYDGMRFDPANNNILSWRDEDEHFKLRSKMSAGVCFSRKYPRARTDGYSMAVAKSRTWNPRSTRTSSHSSSSCTSTPTRISRSIWAAEPNSSLWTSSPTWLSANRLASWRQTRMCTSTSRLPRRHCPWSW